MIVVGAILLILGFVFGVHLLTVLGVILLIVGAVMWAMGSVGRPVAVGTAHHHAFNGTSGSRHGFQYPYQDRATLWHPCA
ncbi:hypothetical protein [Mycobacterium asiaticum]|uniref:hypothetical protein n=1 Tax=Mycobacterium asiaticum TaxID=1790 RepID=UPI0007EF7612|nr:hypothetical protein [Mycobacterium asiaticum]OBJ60363.1 hypothetical protein A9W94_13825 [Mycobacterium asiaticum]